MAKKLEFTEEELQEYGGDYSKAAKAWKMHIEKLKKRKQRAKKNNTPLDVCSAKIRTGPKIKPKAVSSGTNRYYVFVPSQIKAHEFDKKDLKIAELEDKIEDLEDQLEEAIKVIKSTGKKLSDVFGKSSNILS